MKIMPHRFDTDFAVVVVEEIEKKYLNKIIPDVGLCITFYDFIEFGMYLHLI